MTEFDFFFMPSEVSNLSSVVVPADMIVVCNELADRGMLTLFNLNQALQYGSVGGMYYRSELEQIRAQEHVRGGLTFFMVDDLALPEHLGLFAHCSMPPSLPRVSLSLASGFAGPVDRLRASPRIRATFLNIRACIRESSITVKAKGMEVFVSAVAARAIVAGEKSTGDAGLDDLVRSKLS